MIRNPGLAVLLMVLPTLAQEQVAAPQQPMTTSVLLVVDVSGSMGMGGRCTRAVQQAQAISGQPVDQMRLSAIAFSGEPAMWPRGWVELPDPQAQAELVSWLASKQSIGVTNLAEALKAALETEESNLTVVVISDGDVGDLRPILDNLVAGQKAREAKGLGRASVATLSVCGPCDQLTQLGSQGGGGAWALGKRNDEAE